MLRFILQSVGAVIAGYVVSALLTGITIAALGALFPESYRPENIGWVVFNVIYGCAFAVLGGYVVAWLAPSRPMAHALVLGVLMALFALLTSHAVSMAPPSPEYAIQPGWYYPVLAVTVLPSILLGAWLQQRYRKPGTSAA
jgi:heme A synthase